MIEEYLSYLQNVRGVSPKTLIAYRKDLARFAAYCASRSCAPENAERSIVRGFLSELSREGLRASSINRCASALKGFYRHLARTHKRESNPTVGLRVMRAKPSLPTFLSEQEVEELMGKPNDRFGGVRDRLVLELLYSSGCRVAELVRLNLSDLSLDRGTARVHGKGNRDRIVFVGTEAKKAVATWIPMREARVDRDDPDALRALVLNSHGRRITERGVFYLISRYVDRAELGRSVGPHTFRHSFATHVLNHGADLRVVQELLGHANLRTTQIYTHTGIDRLAAVYEKALPHARLQSEGQSGQKNDE